MTPLLLDRGRHQDSIGFHKIHPIMDTPKPKSVKKNPYIGTRDFFPEDMRLRQWMFAIQRQVCTSYGYEEYSSPLLESLDLYLAKSSQEIVNEQMYQFEDRSGRDLAIRPEMTPTLARMISKRRREMPLPIRWFSIANFMRYERPGHGRLREFFQLNVDLLGVAGAAANVEMVRLILALLQAYGAQPDQFVIRYSDRRLLGSYLDISLDHRSNGEDLQRISRVIDKRNKLTKADFDALLKENCSSSKQEQQIKQFFTIQKEDLKVLGETGKIDRQAAQELAEFELILGQGSGHNPNLIFDPSLMRGFDYYTGFIFEVYDCHPQNSNRALLGGGRYDRLLDLFDSKVEPMPAVGFGMGDVGLENFLIQHALVPSHLQASQGVFIVLMSEELRNECEKLSEELRNQGVPIVEQMLYPTRKLGQQFSLAQKKGRRFVIVIGTEELSNQEVTIKDLDSGSQEKILRNNIANYIKEKRKVSSLT